MEIHLTGLTTPYTQNYDTISKEGNLFTHNSPRYISSNEIFMTFCGFSSSNHFVKPLSENSRNFVM